MDQRPEGSRTLLLWIIGGLAFWGALVGLGAYLGLDSLTPDRDVRRMLVIGGGMALFLALWLVALWRRGRGP